MADPQLLRAQANNMAIDRRTVEAVAALNASGIPSILLKGPAIAGWLYDSGEVRPYCDTDLLVSPATFERALEALARLGYEPAVPSHPADRRHHAEALRRPADDGYIDLHWTLPLVPDANAGWTVLERHTVRMNVGGSGLPVLDEPARLVHLCIHAVQNAAFTSTAADDLLRAVDRAERTFWAAAAELGTELGMTGAMRLALEGCSPAGRELIDELGLTGAAATPEARLLAAGDVPGALGLEHVFGRGGVGQQLRLVALKLAPPVAMLRLWEESTGRRSLPLALAYPRRTAVVLARVPAAVIAVRRARRSPSTSRADDRGSDPARPTPGGE